MMRSIVIVILSRNSGRDVAQLLSPWGFLCHISKKPEHVESIFSLTPASSLSLFAFCVWNVA